MSRFIKVPLTNTPTEAIINVAHIVSIEGDDEGCKITVKVDGGSSASTVTYWTTQGIDIVGDAIGDAIA